MTNEEILREFNALPAKARREAEDFIAFLKERYSREAVRSANGNLLDEPFVGMWRDRTEFGDSSAWVRDMRHGEWSD
jgi:hypothetical protein